MLSFVKESENSAGKVTKMSKTTEDKKASTTIAGCSKGTHSACSFESKFVSIAGSRLEVENEQHKKTSYALATDAVMTCDGKVSKEDSLKAGKKIRVTTQKGNPNMVTGIEWLNKNASFPALKTTAAK